MCMILVGKTAHEREREREGWSTQLIYVFMCFRLLFN